MDDPKPEYILQQLYKNTILVANSEVMENYLLVCFEEKNIGQMKQAISTFQRKFHCKLMETDIDVNGKYKGFWLPKKMMLREQDGTDHIVETDEAQHLLDLAETGKITYIQESKDMADLNKKLPKNLDRANIATYGFRLN